MSELTKLQKVQVDLGEDPDDNWGPKCRAALVSEILASEERRANTANLKSQIPNPRETSNPNGENEAKQRWPLEAEAASFYGHSDGSSRWEAEHLVSFPAPYALYMDGQLVRNIRCHRLVKDSLLLILTKILALYKTPEMIAHVGLDQYDGCYNCRPVRGTAAHLSMHAYGAAIDFDAAHNPLGATTGRMPPEVVAIFKAEGWRWGGDYQHRKDWMHFEACR